MLRYKPLYLLFIFFVYGQTNFIAHAQKQSFPLNEWVKKLDAKNDTFNKSYYEIAGEFYGMDTTIIFPVLNELDKKGASAGHYFQIRFKQLKATMLWRVYVTAAKDSITQLFKAAIQQAYELNDEHLIPSVSWDYGTIMYFSGAIEPAAMHCLDAVEMADKTGIRDASKYQFLGEILFYTRDYDKGMYYIRLAIEHEKDTSVLAKLAIASRLNTLALCWHRMGVYDSAFYYYEKALQQAIAVNGTVWIGIISGNKGQVYYMQKKYALAKPLLEFDYRTSKQTMEIASAANSLQWVARVNLVQGKKDSALMQVKEALRMLQTQRQHFQNNFLQNVYYATADVYRALGNTDSFYHYSRLYSDLHDSTERAIAGSRLEISRLRLDNRENIYKIRELQKEKQVEAVKRNFIIAGIILCAAIALLILNRQRIKFRYRQQLALQQKAMAEKEVATAREQLNVFTQNIIEKTSLIEKLEQQIADKRISADQQQLVNELSRQTILTEEDWEKFKTIFETIYPGFFRNLKEKVSDITLAEQRMAALTRLKLSINQIASILGISPNSVYKTRQRLRQRLNLEPEKNIEEILTKI